MGIRRCLSLVAAGTVLSVGPAWAGAPTDQLKESMDEVIRILDHSAVNRAAMEKERQADIHKVIERIFDFPEAARLTLGAHWQDRTDPERKEFIELFSDLLERTCISYIGLYSGEKVRYVGESVGGNYGAVRTTVVTKQGTELPIDYWMHRRGDRWLVYDVSVESVSLISNYRSQLNKIIRTASYGELVKTIKAALEERPQIGRAHV